MNSAEPLEPVERSDPGDHADVLIVGGGLAGLTLALQLRQRLPTLDVLVLERRAHPVPEAAHKVGESSVEIQAHYLAEVLGLKDYLQARQLKKFGFRFFFSDAADDISQVTELGASGLLPTPSYQLDRGRLENDLASIAQARGIRFEAASRVHDFTLGQRGAVHRVAYEQGGTVHQVESQWLIDASGRAGLVKRRLDLGQANDHDANAVWFRIGARIDVGAWSDDPAWGARCNPPNRWLSTNHLVGDGYWVWLIPLASGSHSVGIVADPALHPLADLNTFDKAMDWLAQRQPRLHRDLLSKRDKLQDFGYFKRFSYGCKRVFSGADRWALTGEAGFFLDPFYSPGGDFIAIANTFITELVAQDHPHGLQPPARQTVRLGGMYERIYFLLYQSMLPLYVGQYRLFGDAQVLPLKVLWDYTFYWGVMCQLFFQNRLTDMVTMTRLQTELEQAQRLNVAMQDLLRGWGELNQRAAGGAENPARMLDQASLGWFVELNRGLTDRLDDAAFAARITESLARLATLAAQIARRARRDHADLDTGGLDRLLPAGAADAADDMLFPAVAHVGRPTLPSAVPASRPARDLSAFAARA